MSALLCLPLHVTTRNFIAKFIGASGLEYFLYFNGVGGGAPKVPSRYPALHLEEELRFFQRISRDK